MKRTSKRRSAISGLLLAPIFLLTVGTAFAEDPDSPFIYPTKSDYPTVQSSGKQVKDFIPKHWQVMAKAEGDLNDDKQSDVALVVRGTSSKFKQKNENLGDPNFDTNPRILIVLFKDAASGGYKLAEKSSSIIPIADSPTAQEPFDGISIKDGILQLKFVVWYSAGTWYTSNSAYKFRYQNNKFVLIGADTTELQRNTGAQTKSSYNFLTGKLKTEIGSLADDKTKFSVKWLTIPKTLRPMSAFQKLYDWNVIEGCNL